MLSTLMSHIIISYLYNTFVVTIEQNGERNVTHITKQLTKPQTFYCSMRQNVKFCFSQRARNNILLLAFHEIKR